MATSFQVTFDSGNPDQLAQFWAKVLNYQLQPPPAGFASWEEFLKANNVPESQWDKASAIIDPEGKGPRLYFQKVPEGKSAKNRVHLDINITTGGGSIKERKEQVEAEAERLEPFGAKFIGTYEENGIDCWVVMNDPEGNEFCLH